MSTITSAAPPPAPFIVTIEGWGAFECETLAMALSTAMQSMQASGSTWRWEPTDKNAGSRGISTTLDGTNIDGRWRNTARASPFKSVAITRNGASQ